MAKDPVKSVSLSGERIMWMQPDVDASNFGVDEHGNTVLMDFGDIAMLPESFAASTYRSSDNNLGAITKSLGLSGNANTASMAVISSVLWMVGNPKLGATLIPDSWSQLMFVIGLNEDGYPKAPVSKR